MSKHVYMQLLLLWKGGGSIYKRNTRDQVLNNYCLEVPFSLSTLQYMHVVMALAWLNKKREDE